MKYPPSGVVGAVDPDGKSWCWVHRHVGNQEVASLYQKLGDHDPVAYVRPGPVRDNQALWYDIGLYLDVGGIVRFRLDLSREKEPHRPSWAMVRKFVTGMWLSIHRTEAK